MDHGVEKSIERTYRSLGTKGRDREEDAKRIGGARREREGADERNKGVFATSESGAAEREEDWGKEIEGAGSGEAVDDGVVGDVG